MTISELPEITVQQLSSAIYATTGPRSSGIHLSDIINDIEAVLYPKEAERKSEMTNSWFACVGFIWEQVLSLAFAWLLGQRPKEIIKDGIACSPDGINDELELVDEYKCTWRSSKHTPDEVWRWMVQTKAYCYAASYNVVRFHVLYVMGDYKFSGPQCKVFLIEFTNEELISNWLMLKQHKERMMEV